METKNIPARLRELRSKLALNIARQKAMTQEHREVTSQLNSNRAKRGEPPLPHLTPAAAKNAPRAAAPKAATYAASHLATYNALRKSSPAKAREYLAIHAPAIQSAARRASQI